MTDNLYLCFLLQATNQYSAALHYYLQAGAVCSDFFNKAVPPDVYTDQVKVVVVRLLASEVSENILFPGPHFA